MKSKIRTIAALVVALTALLISSCAGLAAPKNVLSSALGEINASGVVFYKDTSGEPESGGDGYFSPSECALIYGESSQRTVFPLLDSYAVFFGCGGSFREYAVFRVRGAKYKDRVEIMLQKRVDTVKAYMRRTGDGAGMDVADSAKIYESGNYIVFVMSPDPENDLKTIKKYLG